MAGSFEDAVQRWGVLVGSPNTTVEIEFPRMCPSDVTLHYVRMPTDGNIADNDLFEGVVQRTTAGIPAAIDSIMTAEPDHLVLGFGSPGFFAGLDGEQALIDSYVERAGGVGITIPSQSCRRAFEVLEVKRLAVMGSYQPAGARRVREYFEAAGYDVVKEGFQGHGSGTEADFIVLDPQATPLLARRTAQSRNLSELLLVLMILADDRAVASTYVLGELQELA